MLLCLDVGNTHICGGLFDNEILCFQFRLTTQIRTIDEFGMLCKQILRENNYDPQIIQRIAICSVVPYLDSILQAVCEKYFALQPWWLNIDNVPYLKIQYTNPYEVGADRLANVIAAMEQFPRQALIIMDCGTATTFCVVDANGNYLGGAIAPGIRLSMESLSRNTAKLPAVDVRIVTKVVGQNTIESIQSGVFFGALGACSEVITRIKQEVFQSQDVMAQDVMAQDVIILATGGFSSFFADYNLYDLHLPDLVLHGLRIAYTRSVL